MNKIVDVVLLEQIEFGDRFRKTYENIESLAESIKQRGLIQPLAVAGQDNPQYPYKLLAGGRRYMALTLAGVTQVPVRLFPLNLSELELRSIELTENIQREDLSWEEETAIKREIHELQVAIHGEKVSTSPDAPGWAMKDTAELLGIDKSSVSRDIQLAKAREAMPEVFAGCKNKSDAAKVFKAVQEKMVVEELARRYTRSVTPSAKQTLVDCYILEDFFSGVKKVESGTIGFVEIDPPYAINLKGIKKAESEVAKNTEDYNEITPEMYPIFMQKVLKESYRIMSPHSWMIVWFAPEPWFEQMYTWITAAGFRTSRICGVWTKAGGQSLSPSTHLASSYEMFFIARKGDPCLVKQGRSNVFSFDPVPAQKKIHPTERPIELMKELFSTFCPPGTHFAVPFAGSGVSILAGHEVGMTGFGWDITKEYKDRYILKVHQEG